MANRRAIIQLAGILHCVLEVLAEVFGGSFLPDFLFLNNVRGRRFHFFLTADEEWEHPKAGECI